MERQNMFLARFTIKMIVPKLKDRFKAIPIKMPTVFVCF